VTFTGGAIFAAHDALEQVDLLFRAVVHAAEIRAVAQRPVQRARLDAEHGLQLVHERDGIARGAVELVHEGEDRHAAPGTDLEELARLVFHALAGVDHHDDGVHGGEHAVGVLGEVLVAGRVEQVHPVAVVLELEDGRADGDAALLLQLHPVGGGGALVFARGHGAGELHRAAVEQQLLGERRLAGVRVRDDRKGAPALNFFLQSHGSGSLGESPPKLQHVPGSGSVLIWGFCHFRRGAGFGLPQANSCSRRKSIRISRSRKPRRHMLLMPANGKRGKTPPKACRSFFPSEIQ
jgi:hypothetical protein